MSMPVTFAPNLRAVIAVLPSSPLHPIHDPLVSHSQVLLDIKDWRKYSTNISRIT